MDAKQIQAQRNLVLAKLGKCGEELAEAECAQREAGRIDFEARNRVNRVKAERDKLILEVQNLYSDHPKS